MRHNTVPVSAEYFPKRKKRYMPIASGIRTAAFMYNFQLPVFLTSFVLKYWSTLALTDEKNTCPLLLKLTLAIEMSATLAFKSLPGNIKLRKSFDSYIGLANI
jgi:hypothetical protein